MNQELATAIKLLSALAQVQRWEVLHSNYMRSASGRQLYFGLIRHLSEAEGGIQIDSMKEIYYDDGIHLTERGVRLTMRAFEADGVVCVDRASQDKRSRRIFVTEKLQQQMIAHASVARKALNEQFRVFEK